MTKSEQTELKFESDEEFGRKVDEIMRKQSLQQLLQSGTECDKITMAMFCEKQQKYETAFTLYKSAGDLISMERLVKEQEYRPCGMYADLEIEAARLPISRRS